VSRIRTVVFSVPQWERARRHEEDDQTWPVTPPPVLDAFVLEAKELDKIVCAYVDDAEPYPYAIGGSVETYYAYQGKPGWESTIVPGFGKVTQRYGFFPTPPGTLDHYYEYDRDNMDFEIIMTNEDTYAVAMLSGGRKHLLAVNLPGDTFETIMIRAAVVVHVLDGLDGIYSAALPLYKDTVAIAHQRLSHVLKWQFENSRTQSLFA